MLTSGLHISVISGTAPHSFLSNNYPSYTKITEYNSASEVYKSVLSGDTDIAFTTVAQWVSGI